MRRLLVGLALAACASAHALSGVVTHVTDGDTLWVRPDGGAPVKVRMQGIDAPERCQAWGAQAREALAARVLHRQVQVRTRARDDYQRTIGVVEVDGRDVAAWLVREGHAWSQRYRRSLGPYAVEEEAARSARRGIFSLDDPVEPRAFRKAHGPCAR
ncbi:thermonuclease family protein [Piscinibacter sp. HJYY11]|uniref:thermonuclease family protein n=1 Tax=Piscinibacter sp. HJYY11 TaxID=2801333 RepID=UPI00191D800F|nr:thermonuclease family protein [Piscinibacter sp. HJYY11]MBL0730378.1 thermonuclease family protein [Piscinibacter sp. HJYY11]